MLLVLRPQEFWEAYLRRLQLPAHAHCSQHGAVVTLVRSVVDATTMIAKLMVNSNPSLIAASLDKILPNNYLCLVESNKQQIKEITSKSQLENKGDS